MSTPRDLGITAEQRKKLDEEIEKAATEEVRVEKTAPATVDSRAVRKMEPHPIANLFPLLDGDEYDRLVESVRENGLRDAIILCDGKILDGRNRYRACMAAEVEPRFRSVSPGINPWSFVWDKNVVRRHLEAGQQASIWIDFEEGSETWVTEHEQVKAEATAARVAATRETKAAKGAPRSPGSASPSEKRPRKTGHEASAKRARVSPSTLKRALLLKHESPALHAQVKAGKMPLKKAVAEVKLERKRALAAKLDAKPIPLPTGKFDVIVSDPSWPYEVREDDHTHRGKMPYPPMPLEKIQALPVQKLAAKDCVLWLWTTNAFMHEAYHVLEAWGFAPKTILTWKKSKMGAGNYLRNITEHCILAIRGNPTLTLTNEQTWIEGEVREHSRKPESFFVLVEKLCHGSRLEMFSRCDRKGWLAWGAEKGSITPDTSTSAEFMV